MKCYQCNTPLSADDKFCPLCGARNDGTANFCSNCGKPVDPDSRFCAECGAPVKKVEQEEEDKIELPVSGTEIVVELGEKLLENMMDEGEVSHYTQIHNARIAQAESPIRSETPTQPQASTHGSSPSANKIKRSPVSAREASQPAQASVSVPGNLAQSAVASATASVATEVAHVAGAVAVEGVKKAGGAAKTVAIWVTVLAFLIGAISACLAFFVPAPQDTVENLMEAVEELDYEELLGCFDSKTEKQIRAVLGITGNLFGSLTGINLDLEDLMDMAPAMAPYLEIPDLGIADTETVLYADCSEKKILEYCITANNGGSIPSGYLSDNEIVSFLMEYNISLPGLENLIAKTAIVKIVLSNGEVGYLPLVNEGWGDWRIPAMDLATSLEGLG